MHSRDLQEGGLPWIEIFSEDATENICLVLSSVIWTQTLIARTTISVERL